MQPALDVKGASRTDMLKFGGRISLSVVAASGPIDDRLGGCMYITRFRGLRLLDVGHRSKRSNRGLGNTAKDFRKPNDFLTCRRCHHRERRS